MAFEFRYARLRKLQRKSPRYGQPLRLVKGKPDDRIADKFVTPFRQAYVKGAKAACGAAAVKSIVAAVRQRSNAHAAAIIPPYRPKARDAADSDWHALATGLRAQYGEIIQAAGEAAMRPHRARKVAKAPQATLDTSFDLDNPYSQAFIASHTGNLVQGISQDTVTNIRAIIGAGFNADGLTIQQMTALIQPIIGLSPRDADAVMRRYQAMIDGGMTPGQAANMVSDYADDLLEARAETIARTETITAEAQGTYDGWRAAIKAGVLDPDTKREWISSPESPDPNNPCAICIELDGQLTGMSEPFNSSYVGELDMPPAHPRCRCTVELGVAGAHDDDE